MITNLIARLPRRIILAVSMFLIAMLITLIKPNKTTINKEPPPSCSASPQLLNSSDNKPDVCIKKRGESHE